MRRRTFVKLALGVAAWPYSGLGADNQSLLPLRVSHHGGSAMEWFPATVQWSPLPGGTDWKAKSPAVAGKILRAAIDDIIAHGFTGLEYPLHLSPAETREVLDYAQSHGMFITFDRTFEKGGVEIFGRDAPSPISVFSPKYAPAVRENVAVAFAEIKGMTRVYNAFCYHDEPFHAGPQSFGYTDEIKEAFKKRFGYELPPDVASARKDPKVWLDVINFRSDEFPVGWRQAYKIIKEVAPNVKVIMTHDSHTTFGASVGSNGKLAVDDVFHWGADFADTFVFDIYPYMMFDFRYGECGKLPKPRLSQMHYAFGQMRNLVYTYGKQLGFWFGTFNKEWFARFMGPELRAQYWAERETSLTAVAQGANFLIAGYKIPEDKKHWDSLGEGLRLLQKAGPGLVKAPKKKARACFLFPRTQYIQLQEEYWNVGLSYELFLRAFGELDVLHEEQVKDDRLEGYEILALFDVQLLPEEIASRIESFVQAGGIVVADCVPNLNEEKKPLQTMERVFGVRNAATRRIKRSDVWIPELAKPHWMFPPGPGDEEAKVTREIVQGTAFGQSFHFKIVSPRPCKTTTGEAALSIGAGQPALVHHRLKKGQAFLLGFCAQDSYFQTWKDDDEQSREQLEDLLCLLTKAAGIRAHVRSSNPGIEAALRINAQEGFLLVINHEATVPNTRIRLAELEFKLGEIRDVADSRKLPFREIEGGIELDVTVAHDKPRILRLVPARKNNGGA